MLNPAIQKNFDLALEHHKSGRLSEAEQIYRQILAQQPNHVDALHFMGMIAHQTGRNDVAAVLIRQAVALNPNYADAQNSLGGVLGALGQWDEAIAAFEKAIALNLNYAEAYNNLGNVLKLIGRSDEAVAAYHRAIAIKPEFPEVHNNIGVSLQDLGQIDEAIASYRQAIAIHPGHADAHCNLGLALLLQGDLRQGWEEHEWRWECRHMASFRRNLVQPKWHGSPLDGRTLLLHAEQGYGDTLQFIRYLPLVVRQGGKIILEIPAALERLLRISVEGCQVVVRGQPLPAFDVHCPLLGLPRVFGTTLQSIPSAVPYLHADPQDVQKWHARLDSFDRFLKVGLVWSGKTTFKDNRNRSTQLASLAPLWQARDARFFSLQKGEPAAQVKTMPSGLELIDWTEELTDFAETAALIANLDLVITVDTAVAHLAGAMGKPVWTLLGSVPDWRWLMDRQDSPWYPTMRLFRQSTRGDWEPVVGRAVEALDQLIVSRGPST